MAFPAPVLPGYFWDEFDRAEPGGDYTVVRDCGTGTGDSPGPITTLDGRTGTPTHYLWVGAGADSADDKVEFRPTIGAGGGTIEFWARRESEANYDWCTFLIDGQIVWRESGVYPWTRFSYPLTAGAKDIRWVYDADSAYAEGFGGMRVTALTVSNVESVQQVTDEGFVGWGLPL